MTEQPRVQIGHIYKNRPKWQKILALPFIYIPILFAVPVIALAVVIVRLHLTITGARNLKRYTDFLPTWVSHRYNYSSQITPVKNTILRAFTKLFWIFNCKLYCPFSVALIRYLLYLVQVVEIWWCPFTHDKKESYSESDIDQSFWHIYPDRIVLLDPHDKENRKWNNSGIDV